MITIKHLAIALVIALACLAGSVSVGTAHADYIKCHCSPGLALWCEDLDTGESWQASSYNSPQCGGNGY